MRVRISPGSESRWRLPLIFGMAFVHESLSHVSIAAVIALGSCDTHAEDCRSEAVRNSLFDVPNVLIHDMMLVIFALLDQGFTLGHGELRATGATESDRILSLALV